MRITVSIVAIPDGGGPAIAIKGHHVDVVLRLRSHDEAVAAIKFIRSEYDIGLKDAKDITDAIATMGRNALVGTF